MPLYYKIPYIFYHEWTLNIHTHTRARVLQYIYINKKLFINAKSNVTKTLSVVEYYRHLQYNNNTRKRLRKQSIEIFLFIFLVFCLYLLLFIYKKMDTLLIFPPFVVFSFYYKQILINFPFTRKVDGNQRTDDNIRI